ncbi:hypothetical protein SAMN02927924_00130 [Sphingobium faniae]|nr:hypothetical protein SAMN02927924_00130 [Sphingobium faniae]
MIAGSTALLAACNNARDAAGDKVERDAEASAVAAGPADAALGLSEAQLLDADLRGASGVERGDVVQIVRGADGKVDRLLNEIEDSNPDRFVHVPIAGLSTVPRGDDTDLSTSMTRGQMIALPEVKLLSP